MKFYYTKGEHNGKKIHPGVVTFLRDVARIDIESEEAGEAYQDWAESLSSIAYEADRMLFHVKLAEEGPFDKNRFEKNTFIKLTERFKIVVKKDFCDTEVNVFYFQNGKEVKKQNFKTVDEFLASRGWKEKV